MSMESESKRDPILEDYQKDAEELIKLYCNPNLPDKGRGDYVYKTKGLLTEYIELKKFTPQQVDLIIGLIRSRSRSALDPSALPSLTQGITAGGTDSQLMQLVRDLKQFANDPDFHYEIDLRYIRTPGQFEKAEKWATEGGFINGERKWVKSKGRLGTFIQILIEKRIIYGPKKDLKVKEIDRYFTDRYQVNGLDDLIKPKFAKLHRDEFLDLIKLTL